VPPPPIPPNPEKDYLLHQIGLQLRTLRQQSLAQTNSSLPALQSQHNALTNTHHLLLAELNELKSLDAALASNERILQDSMRKADEVIASAAGREVPGVDEVLVAPTVVGGQLYELVCEERAVGDAMFVLGRALERERIGVDVFLKVCLLEHFFDYLMNDG
jgi:ESCRT-I complex subunit TSG101